MLISTIEFWGRRRHRKAEILERLNRKQWMALIWLLGSGVWYVQLRKKIDYKSMAAVVRTWSYLSSCACLQSGRCLNMHWWACFFCNWSSAWWLVFCSVCPVNVLIYKITNFSLINIVTWLSPVISNVLAIIPPHLIQYGFLWLPRWSSQAC